MGTEHFFERPILNSPYERPSRHWELDANGQPTQKEVSGRRRAELVTPIPKPRKSGKRGKKSEPSSEELFQDQFSTQSQRYDNTKINRVRELVDLWRELPESQWGVTPETARLLKYWRHFDFQGIRPFFCQIEAVEVAIWLTEVAPNSTAGRALLDELASANDEANPGLSRLALKLATGAGKTTVMAMLIAWQTVNAVRRPTSNRFTRGFLIVTPGITIRDRLRVLEPSDPNNYYRNRNLIPADFLEDIAKAKIVITNYHSFKLRERIEISKGTRALLKGRTGDALNTLESEGQMIQRVMPELMGLKNILAINDEAHHCYRERSKSEDELEALSAEELDEVEENREAARLWISGLEAVNKKLGLLRVFDLSATPFFLRGSGYLEGTLFPWTMSDFSLMDAIECGIVKLPRVPVSDNIPGAEVPMYRNLWHHIGKDMPKKGRGSKASLDPTRLPTQLQTALDALYGHYQEVFQTWENAGLDSPPCFIIVCNNTASSKLVFDYISGFYQEREQGDPIFHQGRLPLFRNFDDSGQALGRPRTLLIDSQQLESGEALDDSFRTLAADEIEAFRRERVEATGDREAANNLSDAELLREVMNTVGRPGKLGHSIRCVVSVSMLTEGWDANTVTHVLGVRAFGTQLLCEQVIGRALRRYSYELNDDGLFNVEYADIMGIPFDFTAQAVKTQPQNPRKTTLIRAERPDRDTLEIRFPRISGYTVELPDEMLQAKFTEDSQFTLTPEDVGATQVTGSGIIGVSQEYTVKHLADVRPATVVMELTAHLISNQLNSGPEGPPLHLFGQAKRIVRQWLEEGYLRCQGGTFPAQLLYKQLADRACEKICAGIDRYFSVSQDVVVTPDPFNPMGSSHHVFFTTTRDTLWKTDARKCPINYVVYESDWEAQFCRVVEKHPAVLSYVKNQALGFEVPYIFAGEKHTYLPDFIVLLDDGHGPENPLHLVVEIKGERDDKDKAKYQTMETKWIPGVNYAKRYGRWAHVEFTNVWMLDEDFDRNVEQGFQSILKPLCESPILQDKE